MAPLGGGPNSFFGEGAGPLSQRRGPGAKFACVFAHPAGDNLDKCVIQKADSKVRFGLIFKGRVRVRDLNQV